MSARLWLAVWVFVGVVSGVQADDLDATQAQMESVTKELKALQAKIARQDQSLSAARIAVKNAERELAQTAKQLREAKQAEAQARTELANLQAQQQTLRSRIAEQQETIAELLVLAYKHNQQPALKLLLSETRPEDLSRHLHYFSVLSDQQQSKIQNWVNDQQALVALTETAEALVAEKAKLATQLEQEQTQLTQKKQARDKTLAALNQDKSEAAARLKEIEAEQARLAELVATLKAQLAANDLSMAGRTAIIERKGNLPWPIEGRLLGRYGRTMDSSGLRWQGLLIGAAEGNEVRAVHGGRVVFADFFKSHGLLIIIDHGDGVWTLYGRNQALLKDVGSWIEAGEVIAQAGRSGGYTESALYFEVRKDGAPQNPASWLSKR